MLEKLVTSQKLLAEMLHQAPKKAQFTFSSEGHRRVSESSSYILFVLSADGFALACDEYLEERPRTLEVDRMP